MEPVFMILSQSAGMAAGVAIQDRVPIQKVDYSKLKPLLEAAGQRL